MIRAAFVFGIVLVSVNTATAQNSSSFYRADYQIAALEIYRDIIAVRSAAGHGKVPIVANYLADRFREGGFDDEDIHVLPMTLSTGEDTASLVVRYRGNDASGRKPILLIAHMDIVDALPKDWERDPFTLIEEDGYFFGRGSLDDKFGITTLTTTFLRLKAEGFVPTRDLIIAFTGDEESGMETTESLVTTHRNLTDAEYVLNADGGGGGVDDDGNAIAFFMQSAEKTYATFELTIRNPGGHSSAPRKDNAIYELATVLSNIEAYEFPARSNDITLRFFETVSAVTPGELGAAMRAFSENPQDADAIRLLRQHPGQAGLIGTTCVATMLSAGHAENALPQSATATVNCRIFPDVSVSRVQERLAIVAENDNLEIEVLATPKASPSSPLIEEVTAAVSGAVHARYPDVPVIPSMAAYGTDGKETRLAGMPTYGVMGLFMREDDVFAHGLNERVPVDQFYGALEHWYYILNELAGR